MPAEVFMFIVCKLVDLALNYDPAAESLPDVRVAIDDISLIEPFSRATGRVEACRVTVRDRVLVIRGNAAIFANAVENGRLAWEETLARSRSRFIRHDAEEFAVRYQQSLAMQDRTTGSPITVDNGRLTASPPRRTHDLAAELLYGRRGSLIPPPTAQPAASAPTRTRPVELPVVDDV